MPSSPNSYGGFSQRKSPWSSNEERLVTEALERALQPRDEVSWAVRPNLPQIQVFPPRMGYGSRAERTVTIADVLGESRRYPDRRVDFSGSAGSYSGTFRPGMSTSPY